MPAGANPVASQITSVLVGKEDMFLAVCLLSYTEDIPGKCFPESTNAYREVQ